ncbi:hypothetical protein Patl1_30478 [Pistacia atlantica]|uniref:Uncharacterized protein n=1 Tax=Pistacia atlantica TaxID=434234 RepID=A0ACC1AB38_9ROSI|nr:hypothetical protein Patl1_30478 [Pistacia atlantica]
MLLAGGKGVVECISINQYLSLYARSGVLPSKLFQGKAAKNWGRVDNSRFNCCFICVDAATPVLDRYVEQRVDCMIDAGLLDEVYDIYNVNVDYTRGLRQAIGVQEFEDFLRIHLSTRRNNGTTESTDAFLNPVSTKTDDETLKEHMRAILKSSGNNQLRILLEGAIDKVKLNTRRLVRCQKRRLNRLQTLYGWNIHYVDSTEAISCESDESWAADVVEPAVNIITTFLGDKERLVPKLEDQKSTSKETIQRDLWTQYICKMKVLALKLLCFVTSIDRLVGTRYLEVHMSGNNTNRAVDIEKGFFSLGSLRGFAWQSSSNHKILAVVKRTIFSGM